MDLKNANARAQLEPEEVDALRASGVLIEDSRRERPRYFDGRFLAARDLIRDQQYILAREADLGQAAGSGVASGLTVTPGGGDTLVVAAGHGVTPAGEIVLLPRAVSLRLADVPRAEQLSARFGLGRIPQPPLRSRTGLFVLALRPVEFTANPVGAYPSSITGARTVEDGDVIEATAVVLVPWDDDGADDALQARRGRAAAAIFAAGGVRGLASSVLPLAMVAMQNNIVAWVDGAMVRRELGADRADLPGLGYAPRALRLAHLLQHQGHVDDILENNGRRGFAAREHFALLPPAGPLPPGTINASDFTQRYFPPEVAVDFSIVPDDELAALVEESLQLPAIDLEAGSATLEATSVLILAPVPRNEWRAVSARLATRIRPLRPTAINLVATRKPLEILQRLRLPRVVPALPLDPSLAEWARLAALPELWFVRRRNLAYRDDLAGDAVRLAALEVDSDVVVNRMRAIGLDDALTRVMARATPLAASEATAMLASARFADSPTLSAAALAELARAQTLDRAAVLRVAADLTAPGVGDGLLRLESARVDTVPSRTALREIADGADWRGADASAASASRAELTPLANKVLRPRRPKAPAAEPAADAAPRAAASGTGGTTGIDAAKTKADAGAKKKSGGRRKAAPATAVGERAATSPSGRRRGPRGGDGA